MTRTTIIEESDGLITGWCQDCGANCVNAPQLQHYSFCAPISELPVLEGQPFPLEDLSRFIYNGLVLQTLTDEDGNALYFLVVEKVE